MSYVTLMPLLYGAISSQRIIILLRFGFNNLSGYVNDTTSDLTINPKPKVMIRHDKYRIALVSA